MQIKECLTPTNIFIGICGLIIIVFIFQITGTLNEVYSNSTISTSDKIDLVSSFSSLIVVLISIISITINTKLTKDSIEQTNQNISDNQKYNEKSINQTTKLLEQNEELLFIQLRFNDTKYGIDYLMLFLQITLLISLQIHELNDNECVKNKYLSERGFLIMQFVNLTSNIDLLNKLPITLREKIEYEFEDKLTNNKFIDDYILEYNIIMENKPPKKLIRNYIEYNNYIYEFKKNEHPEQNKFMFRAYYGSKNISTQSFYNHFYNLYYELTHNSIETLILRDKIKPEKIKE